MITTNEELTNRNREMASLNEALRASGDYAEAIVQTTPSPLLVLDASLHVMKANDAFYQSFKTRAEDTEGRYLYDLGDKDWDIAGLHEALKRVLPEDGRFRNFEVRHAFKGLGEKILLLGARRLRGGKSRPEMVLLSIEDDTQRKRVEEELRWPTGTRTSSWRCWRTSCATRWRRSATPRELMRPSAGRRDGRARRAR